MKKSTEDVLIGTGILAILFLLAPPLLYLAGYWIVCTWTWMARLAPIPW